MFTGLIQSIGTVTAIADTGAGKRLTAALGELASARIDSGDSICVSGVCLTVAKRDPAEAQFDVIAETLHFTTLGDKKPHDPVNLELSLRPDSYVGGHFVQGHVEAVASVIAVKQDPSDWRITFRVPRGSGGKLEKHNDVMACLTPKGSVAVDGVSMTVAEVGSGRDTNAGTFTVAVIPTTLEKTTLGALKMGDRVNVETDMLNRAVVHFLRMQQAGPRIEERGGGPVLIKHQAATLAKLHELGRS
jgi:riboflavin synthase